MTKFFSLRVNFRNYVHTEELIWGKQLCGREFLIFPHCVRFTLTEIIFRQITYLVISLVKLLFSRNFCQNCAGVNSRNFHSVHCTGNYGNLLSLKKISSNRLFSNFFSKTVTFTKFLPKIREMRVNSRNFHTVHCVEWKLRKCDLWSHTFLAKISSK